MLDERGRPCSASRSSSSGVAAPMPDEIDIAAVATVLVTSEAAEHPVDHAFDAHRGPGGSRWVAGEPGEQTLILAFDAPQAIRRVAWRSRKRRSPARRNSSSPSPPTAGGPTGRCSGRSTTSARRGRPSSGRTGGARRGRHAFAAADPAGQGGQALPGDDHLADLAVKAEGFRTAWPVPTPGTLGQSGQWSFPVDQRIRGRRVDGVRRAGLVEKKVISGRQEPGMPFGLHLDRARLDRLLVRPLWTCRANSNDERTTSTSNSAADVASFGRSTRIGDGVATTIGVLRSPDVRA